MFHSFLSLEKRWKEFVAVRSDANTMFDLCSDTQSAKTIKQLQDVVDSLSARLRTGLRSRQSASDVQALHKQISQLESEVNGLHDDLAAPAKLHIKVKGMLTLGVRDALAGHNAHRFIFHSFLSRLSQETQNLVVEKEDMSLVPGSQMEEGQDMEEDDVFGRSTVLKNRKDTVVGQETPAQSGGVQESVDMFTDTFLPIADIPDNTGGTETAWGA